LGQIVESNWHNWWDVNDWYTAVVRYDHNSDCSLYVYESLTWATKINSPWYRGKDTYVSQEWDWPCQFQGAGYLDHNPQAAVPSGHYYEQWEYVSSVCNDWFSDSGYTTMFLS
jgi:hypothetical protein